MLDEEKLSEEAKAVLAIVRKEAAEGRLTERQEQLLNKAIVLHDALGMISSAIIWFAGLLAAVAALWSYVPWPKGK